MFVVDVKNINYVINFQFPLLFENYIHRIGRTGRASKTGVAYTYVTEEDKEHVLPLIKVLRDAKQEVNKDLLELSTRVGYVKGKNIDLEDSIVLDYYY